MLLALLISTTIVLITYCVLAHLYELWRVRHIPGVSQILPLFPIRVPLLAPYLYVGNKDTAAQLRKRFEHYGLYRVTAFTRTYVMLIDLEAVRHAIVKNVGNYPKPTKMYRAIDVYGMNIVSAPGGELHRKHRRVVEPAFAENHLRHLVEISNSSTELLIKKLERNAKESSDSLRINVYEDLNDITMDIIGKSAFGTDLNIFNESIPDAKYKLYDSSKHKMSFFQALDTTHTIGLARESFIPIWLHWLPIFNKITLSIEETKKYIEELIDQHRNGDYLDLLSLLVKANELEGEGKLSHQEIISDAFIFLFAGFETSASNMSWILYELAKNPDILKKVHEELDRVLPNGKELTYDDIDNLTYLNAVIHESLRLHSPVQAVPKINKTKDIINGYVIPKNTITMIHFQSIHENDKYWENASKFIPERFLQKYESIKFLSFSYGNRRCVGFKFSLIETATILTKLLRKFSIHFEPGIDPQTFKPNVSKLITVRVLDLHLVLKPRNANPVN
jgi:cytochrome P450